jgi:HK97 family phage prohead protease
MKTYEVKNFDNRATDFKDAPFDVDDKSRRVKIALNKAGVKDHDKDIIEETAYDKTIKERGPKGKGLIWHLTDHWPSLKHAVGRFKELFMENRYLVGVTDIPNTSWGNDVLEFYKTGHINQHSIGFSTVKREIVNEDKPDVRHTIIKEVMLYEGSAVLWGANEFTPTIEVGKSLTIEEATSEYEKTLKEVNSITKLFRTGHLSDESFELLELKLQQLTDKLQHLFTTLPAQKAVEPDLKGVFNNFINTLNGKTNDSRRIESATG